jgi:hypothetical protein
MDSHNKVYHLNINIIALFLENQLTKIEMRDLLHSY